MGKAFNFEGPVFTFLSRLADLFWLNLLFIICSIPVITIGAASTALYYVTLKMAKDEEGYITKSYFKSFKDNFVQATGIWLLFLVVAVIMLFDLRIANGSAAQVLGSTAVSNVVIVAVGVMTIVAMMTMLYVFPILAQFDNTVKNTIKNSFLISIRHLPYTFLMLVITAIPVGLVLFFPPLLILVLIMFSGTAYINSRYYNKVFAFYMPKEEGSETGSDDPAEVVNGEG